MHTRIEGISRKDVSFAIIKGGRQAFRIPLGWARACGFDDGTKVKISFEPPRGRARGWRMFITKVLRADAAGTGIVSLHLTPGHRNLDFMQQSQEYLFKPIMRARKVRAMYDGADTIEIPFPIEAKRDDQLIALEPPDDAELIEAVADQHVDLNADPAAEPEDDKPLSELANDGVQIVMNAIGACKLFPQIEAYALGAGWELEEFEKAMLAIRAECW